VGETGRDEACTCSAGPRVDGRARVNGTCVEKPSIGGACVDISPARVGDTAINRRSPITGSSVEGTGVYRAGINRTGIDRPRIRGSGIKGKTRIDPSVVNAPVADQRATRVRRRAVRVEVFRHVAGAQEQHGQHECSPHGSRT
jgi:hypothetical protein